MTDSKIRKLVLSALMAALCTVMTMVIQVPSPMQGYVNLGDCAVLISAWMLGPLYGRGCRRHRLCPGRPAVRLCPLCPRHIRHQVSHGCGRRFDPSGHDQKGPLRHAGRSGGGRRGRRGHHGPGLFRLCQPVAGQGAGAAASIPGNIVQGVFGLVAATVVYTVLSRSRAVVKV